MADIKHIKLYPSKPKSFKELLEEELFNFIHIQNQERSAYFYGLLHFIREIEPNHNATDAYLEQVVEDALDLYELENDISLDLQTRTKFKSKMLVASKASDYTHLRGKALEYLVMYFEKNTYSKNYHEPVFFHKRKKLFKNSFPGSECLVDIVNIKNDKSVIKLIECKANLDMKIFTLSSPKAIEKVEFKKKLNYMDSLERELSNFINKRAGLVNVKKILSTINTNTLPLPAQYQNYEIINVFNHFRKFESSFIS